tara:strand:+ start:151 stop:393 length:243 start_codon:yes stop_codon:yes gene_type:complete
MTTTHHKFNPGEILDSLQYCANRLLLAYDDTLETELWDAFGNTADACQSLLCLIDNKKQHDIKQSHLCEVINLHEYKRVS